MRLPFILTIALLFIIPAATSFDALADTRFTAVNKPLPDWVIKRMKRHSWREGCPVPLEKLSYIYLKHWGFDDKVHDGRLVVHQEVSKDVVEIFKILFRERFPIEKMKLIDDYKGSDDKSMADNNTSAFNCRSVTGRPGVFSKHSYGLAIDINPLFNPYILKNTILPPAGKDFVNRQLNVKGMIKKGDAVYRAFREHGWTWGGDWFTIKDYQHFQTNIKKHE